MNMKTKLLLLGTIVATLAGTTFASDALLSPRAKDNQIKVVAASVPTASVAVDYVDSATPISPRLQEARIKVVKGIIVDRNPALECRANMLGTPRAVTACSQSVTMPGCTKLASK